MCRIPKHIAQDVSCRVTTPPCRKFSKFPFLPPKMKLWQGNVFTPVCQSFYSWGVSVQGVSVLGFSVQGVSVQEVYVWGVSLQGGLCHGMHSCFMEFYNGSL